MMLNSALAKDRTERAAACEALSKTITAEAVRTEKAIQALHSETYGHVMERTRATEFQALQMKVLELSRELDNETRAREQHCGVLDNMIAANYAADKTFSQRTLNELSIAKDQIDKNNISDLHFHGTVVPRLVTAGHLLRSGAFNSSVGAGQTRDTDTASPAAAAAALRPGIPSEPSPRGTRSARQPVDMPAAQESMHGSEPRFGLSSSNMGALSRKLAEESRDEMA